MVNVRITCNFLSKSFRSIFDYFKIGVREQGALDVAGEAFFSGDLDLTGNAHMSGLSVDGPTELKNTNVTGDFLVNGFPSGVESGSNPNGQWVKFPDGTLVAHYSIHVTRSGNWSAVSTWTYPVRFVGSNPAITATFDNRSNVANLGELEHALIFLSPTLSNATVRLKPVTGNRFLDTSLQTYVNLVAIGRWK